MAETGVAMEPIDWADEFRPLDQEQIDYLIRLASDLKDMSTTSGVSHGDSSTLGVASYQVLRLMAMATAGFALYVEIREAAENLTENLRDLLALSAVACPEVISDCHYEAIRTYEEFKQRTMEEGF